MAKDRNRKDRSIEEERHDRNESRRNQTYIAFLHELEEAGDLSTWEAEQAAVAVLCALEQRLTPEEAHDMASELPMKLRELIESCPRKTPEKKIDKIELIQMVGRNMQLEDWEAEPIVRTVFSVVQRKLSAGEAADVGQQLPKDLRQLWEHPDDDTVPYVTDDEYIRHDNQAATGDYTSTQGPKTSPGWNAGTSNVPGKTRAE